jgi:WD40 repeat protein
MKFAAFALTSALLVAAPAGSRAQEVKELATFKGHTLRLNCVALSCDGKILASGAGNTRGRELKLWDVAGGAEIATLPAGDFSWPNCLVFSPDGKYLASGDYGKSVTLWDVAARKQHAVLKRQVDYADALAFSQDGKKLAAAGQSEVSLWDVATGKDLAHFTREFPVYYQMAFSGDLSILATQNVEDIDLWNVASGKMRAILSEHRGQVGSCVFNANDTMLATASVRSDDVGNWIGELKLWDVGTAKERRTLPGDFGYVQALALSPDGKTLALLDRRGIDSDDIDLKVLALPTGHVRLLCKAVGPWRGLMSLTYTTSGRFVCSPHGRRQHDQAVGSGSRQEGRAGTPI